MLFILTFISVLLAVAYYALISNVLFDSLFTEFFASIIIFVLGIGGLIFKYSVYKYEHMSRWRYLSGFIVLGVLSISMVDYFSLWGEAHTFWNKIYLSWMGFLALFILSLPIWDITYSRDSEHAGI